jgi:DNA-binding MarR family transcriptional regulator
MQPLQNASDPYRCAETAIEASLDVILLMRESTARRQHQTDGPSLVHLRAMGVLRKRPGATLSALAAQLALTLSATSRLIDCLVARGYVLRAIPRGNRRTVALHLTPAGAKVHHRARDQVQRDLARLLTDLSPAQRSVITRAAQLLRETLEAAVRSPKSLLDNKQ